MTWVEDLSSNRPLRWNSCALPWSGWSRQGDKAFLNRQVTIFGLFNYADRGRYESIFGDELSAFATEHLEREELYLDSVKYPGAKQHKEVHRNLLGRFAYQRKEFESNGFPADSKFFEFLNVWLMSHIKGIDAQYGAFVTNGAKAG